jgi:integrase
MPTNQLTDSKCKAVRPSDRPQKLFDGGGLHLFVSPSGAKTWRVAYRLAGKQQTMSLGPYPEVSLAEARIKRDALKATLRDGGDPMAPRKAMRKGVTLKQAAQEYWGGRKDISDSYRANVMRGLEMHLYPVLGERQIGSVTRDELLDELRKMDASGKHDYVRKVRMWSGQVWDWAVEHGYAVLNPAALIRPEKAFTKAAVTHFAALELNEVPAFLDRLRLERDLNSVLACRLLAYTWSRTAELRMMRWEEIDEADALWRLPDGRMKMGRGHVVPLPRQAIAVIREMRARSRGGPYVFPCDRRIDRPMSENAILYLIHRIGYKGRLTGHGWRTIGSTWANERGYSADAIERQLSHMPEDRIRATYNRAEYLAERRTMLQAWADWLDACEGKEATQVTPG